MVLSAEELRGSIWVLWTRLHGFAMHDRIYYVGLPSGKVISFWKRDGATEEWFAGGDRWTIALSPLNATTEPIGDIDEFIRDVLELKLG